MVDDGHFHILDAASLSFCCAGTCVALVQGQRLKDPLKPTIVCFKSSLMIKKGPDHATSSCNLHLEAILFWCYLSAASSV